MSTLFDDQADYGAIGARAPTPEEPWWRAADGRRSSALWGNPAMLGER